MKILKLSLRTQSQQRDLKKFADKAVALIVVEKTLDPLDKCSSVRDAIREIGKTNRTDLAIVDMLA